MGLFTKILQAIMQVFGIVSKRQDIKSVYVEEHRPAEAAKAAKKVARLEKQTNRIDHRTLKRQHKRYVKKNTDKEAQE
jgi:hypothetical protein